jgi:hypothetical protein
LLSCGRKKLRTPLNVFFVSLSVSDVIAAAFDLPLLAYSFAAESWELGDVMCRVHFYVGLTSSLVSVYSMVSVAVFRCQLMTRSDKIGGERSADMRHAIGLAVGLWIVLLLIGLPIISLYAVIPYPSFNSRGYYLICQLAQPDHSTQLYLLFFVFAYVLPVSIATACYSVIIITLKRQSPKSTLGSAGQSARKRNVRVTRLLIIVLAAFTLCWLPLHAQLIFAFTSNNRQLSVNQLVIRLLTLCLAYSSTVVNSVTYSFANSDFRQGLKDVVTSWNFPCHKLRRSDDSVTSSQSTNKTVTSLDKY